MELQLQLFSAAVCAGSEDVADWQEWCERKGLDKPDHVVTYPDLCRRKSAPFYLIERGERKGSRWTQSLPGVYVWVDQFGEVLYVGKAERLWNRISAHWNRAAATSSFMVKYRNDCKASGISPRPVVLVWRSGVRAGMEAELIQRLRPRYSRRRE